MLLRAHSVTCLLALLTAFTVLAPRPVEARPFIRQAWDARYPDARGTIFDASGPVGEPSGRSTCGVCHRSGYGFDIGGERNAYGADIAARFEHHGGPCGELDAGCAIAAVEGADSDLDGVSNLAEITARTWPGYSNASCPPEAGWRCEAVADSGADLDQDSLSPAQGDCNDSDPRIHPYAPDHCGDGIDQDCDGLDAACGASSDEDTSIAREFEVETIATGLLRPVSMAMGPDGRLYVTEHAGRVRTLTDPAGPTPSLGIFAEDLFEPYGLAFGPDGRAYVSQQDGTIVRFTDVGLDGVADSQEVFVSGLCTVCLPFSLMGLSFDDAGNLYVGKSGDEVSSGFTKITPAGVVSLYATGVRTPTDSTFLANGRMIAPDNGPETFDELNEIVEGANYGWPGQTGVPDPGSGTERPIFLYPKGVSPTGITAYRDDDLCGFESDVFIAFFHSFAFADPWLRGRVERVTTGVFNGSAVVHSSKPFLSRLNTPSAIAFDDSGHIYVSEYWGGKILRITPLNTDGDPLIDLCDPDDDGDGIADASDNCPMLGPATQDDGDGDGVGDLCDNCPNVANPDQSDLDHDGYGDVCEQGTCGSVGGRSALDPSSLAIYLLLPVVVALRRRRQVVALAVALFAMVLLAGPGAAHAGVLAVPGSYATVQAAIDAAIAGDEVAVAPGTYYENLDFHGKAITLRSTGGPEVTLLNGGMVGPVVRFESSEQTTSVLEGFTITRGFGLDDFNAGPLETSQGGGISVEQASPTIRGNRFTENLHPGGFGGAIGVLGGAPVIVDNFFQGNLALGGALGVLLASPVIEGNRFEGNTGGVGGGGMYCLGCTAARIINNVFEGNRSFQGGAITLQVGDGGVVAGNLIVNNDGDLLGGAIYVNAVAGTPLIANNTIVGNRGPTGAGIFVNSSPGVRIVNNIFASNVAAIGGGAIACRESPGLSIEFNDLWLNGAEPTRGCTLGTGNLAADPGFADAPNGNFDLGGVSAVVDVGQSDVVPSLPATDLAGRPRVANGSPGGSPVVDMGAYELPE